MPAIETPINDGGKNVGMLYRIGTEIHFEIYPEYRHWWILQRKKVKAYMQSLLDDGVTTTRLDHSMKKEKRLIEGLGFAETWRDEQYIYFMLENSPF